MKTTFQDFKQLITISQVAELLGYKLTSSQNAKHFEYQLRAGNSKMDEIVIYRNGTQTFFSRGIGDKGDLINFVLNRLNMFSNAVGSGYEGVYSVLCNISGRVEMSSKNIVPTAKEDEIVFNISDYEVTCKRNVIFAYLNKIRRISMNTISDFLQIQSICTVAKKNQTGNYSNVAFPFRVLDAPEKVVNFELRNYNSYKKVQYKGFCTGGNKSSACWIASFAGEWSKVKNLYIGESALDMMALYELLEPEERKNSAFISVGGNLLLRQIKNIRTLFPNAVIHLSFDNDAMGQIYDVEAAYYLVKGCFVKGFKREDEITFSSDDAHITFNADSFSSLSYLIDNDLYPSWLHLKKALGAKDFNDMLKLKNN